MFLRRGQFRCKSSASDLRLDIFNLPTDVLRNFIAIVETGSILRASKQTSVTQSALSLQIKRLSEIVGSPVFSRHKSRLILTSSGDELLMYAREIIELNDRALSIMRGRDAPVPVRIGIVQDLAAPLLTGVFTTFLKLAPRAEMKIRVGSTMGLTEQFEAGLLDILLGLGPSDDPDAVSTSQLAWLGSSTLADRSVIPLAFMDGPCPFRDAALTALGAGRIAYRLVLETSNVAVLQATVEAGLALTCRTEALSFSKVSRVDIPRAPLGRIGFIVRCDAAADPTILQLHALVRTALADLEGLAS